jgi:hypothetical protein
MTRIRYVCQGYPDCTTFPCPECWVDRGHSADKPQYRVVSNPSPKTWVEGRFAKAAVSDLYAARRKAVMMSFWRSGWHTFMMASGFGFGVGIGAMALLLAVHVVQP